MRLLVVGLVHPSSLYTFSTPGTVIDLADGTWFQVVSPGWSTPFDGWHPPDMLRSLLGHLAKAQGLIQPWSEQHWTTMDLKDVLVVWELLTWPKFYTHIRLCPNNIILDCSWTYVTKTVSQLQWSGVCPFWKIKFRTLALRLLGICALLKLSLLALSLSIRNSAKSSATLLLGGLWPSKGNITHSNEARRQHHIRTY